MPTLLNRGIWKTLDKNRHETHETESRVQETSTFFTSARYDLCLQFFILNVMLDFYYAGLVSTPSSLFLASSCINLILSSTSFLGVCMRV